MGQWKDWGCIYIVRSGSRYKIGYTTGPVWQRLTALQTGSPGKITLVCEMPTPDPKRIERHLHERFADRRVRGEWYALTGQDVRALKAESQTARTEYIHWQLQRSLEREAHSGWL